MQQLHMIEKRIKISGKRIKISVLSLIWFWAKGEICIHRLFCVQIYKWYKQCNSLNIGIEWEISASYDYLSSYPTHIFDSM